MSLLQINNKKKYQEPEVYSTTGFKDVLGSPVFYSVLVITFVLGVSSILGFLQNPLKLKSAVNMISQKVTTSPLKSNSRKNQFSFSSSDEISADQYQIDSQTTKLYLEEKLDEEFSTLSVDQELENGLRRLAFNYDITSRQFWTDLDTSTIESAIEESQNDEASLIGAPIELDYFLDTQTIDASIYSLTASNKY